MEDVVPDSQRIHDDPIFGVELHEIKAAECRRVLILPPAEETGVLAFNAESELGNIVLTQGQLKPLGIRLNNGDDQGGR